MEADLMFSEMEKPSVAAYNALLRGRAKARLAKRSSQ